MDSFVTSVANGIARRTSRRGFLGRTGQLLLGAVGGTALMSLMLGAERAHADDNSVQGCCDTKCYHWGTCDCSGRLRKHYDCPSCSYILCQYAVCTNLACGLASYGA
jgi:hypothetical protein